MLETFRWRPRPISAAEAVELVTWFRSHTGNNVARHVTTAGSYRGPEGAVMRVDASIPQSKLHDDEAPEWVIGHVMHVCAIYLYGYTVSDGPYQPLQSVLNNYISIYMSRF